jgi:hypothetical protein
MKARLLSSPVILEYNQRLEKLKDENSKKSDKEKLQLKKVEQERKEKWNEFLLKLKNRPLLIETYSKTLKTSHLNLSYILIFR